MSNLAQFSGGNQSPKTIVNAFSTSGATAVPILLNGGEALKLAKVVSVGSVTAGVLKTIVSVTGAGQIDFLSALSGDATARTLRVKVTLDGVVAFDSTTASVSIGGNGISVIGAAPSAGGMPMVLQPVFFNASLLVEFASSVTETGISSVGYTYRTF